MKLACFSLEVFSYLTFDYILMYWILNTKMILILITAACAPLPRAAVSAVHPGPGQQGAGAADGTPLRLCPHILQVPI